MRYQSPRGAQYAKGDMTPMIDMTFQLIAFFMVLVNFSEADQNERVTLPSSELAKPAEAPLENPITLHVTDKGTIILGPDEVTLAGLERLLIHEKQFLEARSQAAARAATIIIRADRATKTGEVQEVIRVCQKVGFEKFALRARQEQVSLSVAGA